MGQVMERVQARFPDAGPERIRNLVNQAHHEYDGRPIREFVPVLVERDVTNSLRATRSTRPIEVPRSSSLELQTQ
jgi:hypothetical protein